MLKKIKQILIYLIKKIIKSEFLLYKNIPKNEIMVKDNNKIIIEVGANKGTDTIKFLNEGYKVYAFEPTPELCVMLQNRFSNYKNFFLIPLAVDVNNSFREFNIAKHTSWGISSFYKFDTKGKEVNARKDLYYDQAINSMTIRLDTFLTNFNIEQEISYLWIDTQGNDLNVLKSLGEKINKVQKGKCEASLKFPLYMESNNDAKSIQDFLKEKKFKINITEHPGEKKQECDVHFSKY